MIIAVNFPIKQLERRSLKKKSGLVEQRTGNAEVMALNPVEALIIFFRLLLSNCLNWKIYCDDHSLLSCLIFLTCLDMRTSYKSQRGLFVGFIFINSSENFQIQCKINLYRESVGVH